MKTFVKISSIGCITQLLDCRDPRYQHIIDHIDMTGFVEIEITKEQIDAIASGERYDYIDGQLLLHTPTAEEIAETLRVACDAKLAAITVHDCSPEVNSFRIGGAVMWLDRDTRVSLSRTIGIEAAAGALTTTIWYNDALPPVRFDLPIEAAQAMLSALEIYAKECFNATQAHRAAVYALDTTYQIEAYDHTAGYPEKLTFNLS